MKVTTKKVWTVCGCCGKKTFSASGVCGMCQERGFKPAVREFPDYDFSKDSEIARWNRAHPLSRQCVANLHLAIQNYFDRS